MMALLKLGIDFSSKPTKNIIEPLYLENIVIVYWVKHSKDMGFTPLEELLVHVYFKRNAILT